MKAIFAIVTFAATLIGTSAAQAKMSGEELFLLAAQTVLTTGEGHKVENCANTEGDDELLGCINDNANVSYKDYEKIKKGELLTGFVKVSYYDNSGDCALSVTIDTDKKNVDTFTPWMCH